MKHVLTVKSMSPGGVKYEFKFAGFGEREERIFRKVADTFKYAICNSDDAWRRSTYATSTPTSNLPPITSLRLWSLSSSKPGTRT
jgi:hypothetical protein